MSESYHIFWRKWSDPLRPLVEGHSPSEDEEDPSFHESVRTFGLPNAMTHPRAPRRRGPDRPDWNGPAIVGPLGIVPLHESNVPSTLYNFWMGHANFDITDAVALAIEATPGVETMTLFSRYRFRLGIGMAFNEDGVMKAVGDAAAYAFAPPPPEPEPGPAPRAPLDRLMAMLSGSAPFWAIVVLPGGRHAFATGGSQEQVLKKVERFDGRAERTLLSWEQ